MSGKILRRRKFDGGAAASFPGEENHRQTATICDCRIAAPGSSCRVAGIGGERAGAQASTSFQLSRSLGLPRGGSAAQSLIRMLVQHGNEWKSFHAFPWTKLIRGRMGHSSEAYDSPLEQIAPAELGERLRIAREAGGINQAEAASAIEVARTTLVAIEQGQRRVRMTELQQLAKLYGTSVNAVLRQEAIQVDLAPRFRKLAGTQRSTPPTRPRSCWPISRRLKSSWRICLGVKRVRNYPPERPILRGRCAGSGRTGRHGTAAAAWSGHQPRSRHRHACSNWSLAFASMLEGSTARFQGSSHTTKLSARACS